MRRKVPSLLLAVALATALGGCRREVTIDASSYKTLNASLNQMRTKLPPKPREDFDEARKRFNATYFPGGNANTQPGLKGTASWQVVGGMGAAEFVAYVRTLDGGKPTERSPTFPNPALASRLLTQYQMELDLLREMRDQQFDRGRNTVDQFPVLDVTFVPPSDDMPIEQDRAVFRIQIRNESQYDAYNPQFRLVVEQPGDDVPVLDRTFVHDTQREPIGPGEEVSITYECCSLGLDPIHNSALKKLLPEAKIHVDVLQVRSHDSQELLDRSAFSMADAGRMKVLELCIKRISADVRGWVPYAQADEPGGCGDPDQRQNLLAMWRAQGVTPPRAFADSAATDGAMGVPAEEADRPLATPDKEATSPEQPTVPTGPPTS